MGVLYSEPTLSVFPEGFVLFHCGENLRGGFQQNIDRISGCIFSTLCQYGYVGGFREYVLVCYVVLLLFWVSLAFKAAFVICL